MEDSARLTDYGHNGFRTVIVAALLILMTLLMVGGRLVSRRLQKASLGLNDYILVVAAVLSCGVCALAIDIPRIGGVGAFPGLAKDPTTEKTFIAWMISYGLAVAFSKGAILGLYTRVFTTANRPFVFLCYAMGFVIAAVCLANSFGVIFQCTPVSFAWDKSGSQGTCMDFAAFERYTAIPNIVTGLIMLVMPLPLIWKLNISPAAKVALTATFLHGGIGLVASVARVARLFSPDSIDQTNDLAIEWTIWTLNEPANYCIAACLPTLRPIFVRILPSSFFLLSKKKSTAQAYTSTPKNSREPGSASRRSMPHGNAVGVAFTNPRFSGPWTVLSSKELQTSVYDSEKDLVGSRGELVINHQAEKTLDLEDGRYLVTTTVEVGSEEHLCTP